MTVPPASTCDPLATQALIGLLFGRGAHGTTTAQTDGGLFSRLARGYLAHPLALR